MIYGLYDINGSHVMDIVCPQATELACEQYAEKVGRRELADQFGSVELVEE